MSEEQNNKDAAKSLVERAMIVTTSGLFNLLLSAAVKLDSTIDYKSLNSQWIDKQYQKE